MHAAASDYIFASFHTWRDGRSHLRVLEIGSLNINGTVRDYIQPFAEKYIGIDMQEGPGVDIVHDAAKFTKPNFFDVVVCAEVFEHTQNGKLLLRNLIRI